MKNQFKHNEDGTTHIFVETKNKNFPGKHTIIIDTEDWGKVKEHRWSIQGGEDRRYPWQGKEIRQRRRTTFFLHHLIAGKPQKGKVIDHKNHDGIRTGLDNRKDNLREVTLAQNQQNRRSSRNSSSQYKGVAWHKRGKKWEVKIEHKGKPIHLGYHTCEHQAALAYNKKTLELWGEYAHLNEVKTQEETGE